MYIESWQIFLVGCVIGTLISFIVLSAFIIRTIGRIGFRGIKFEEENKQSKKESIENINAELISKLCFILMAKGYLDEVDNEFMTDKIDFNDWKSHVEELIAEEDNNDSD